MITIEIHKADALMAYRNLQYYLSKDPIPECPPDSDEDYELICKELADKYFYRARLTLDGKTCQVQSPNFREEGQIEGIELLLDYVKTTLVAELKRQ